MDQQRSIDLDLTKGIGILLVIVGHIQYISDDLRNFIVTFHIPLFFIMAGILLQYKQDINKTLSHMFIKKTKSILQPYFIFSLIFIVAQYEAYRIGSSISLDLVKHNIYLTAIFYGMSVLWFLAALFIAELIFIVIRKYFGRKNTPYVLLVYLIVTFVGNRLLNSYRVIHNMPQWEVDFLHVILRIGIIVFLVGVGYYFWFFYKKIKMKKGYSLLVGILLLVITVFVSKYNGGVDLHFLVFGNEILYVIGAITGSLGTYFICNSLTRWDKTFPLRVLSYYGKNSLIVMMTHVDTYLMYLSTIFVMHFNKDITEYKDNVLFCIEIFMLVTFCEGIIIFIINRFFPWMVGKEERKKNGHHKKI